MVWEVVQNVGGRADKYTADIKFLGDQKFSKRKQIPVATAYYTPCIVAHLQQHECISRSIHYKLYNQSLDCITLLHQYLRKGNSKILSTQNQYSTL